MRFNVVFGLRQVPQYLEDDEEDSDESEGEVPHDVRRSHLSQW